MAPTSSWPTTGNFLYRNRGNGTFDDIAYGAGVGFDMGTGKTLNGMGVDIAAPLRLFLPDISFFTAFSRHPPVVSQSR